MTGMPAPDIAPMATYRTSRWPRLLGPAAVWASLAVATAYVLTSNPTDNKTDLTGPCLFHEMFGINGPLCGGTRMYWYLIHGDLVEAFRHHPIALIAAPVILYALVWWTAREWFGRTLPALRLPSTVYFGYVAVGLLFLVVLRNLPEGPFTWFNIPYLG